MQPGMLDLCIRLTYIGWQLAISIVNAIKYRTVVFAERYSEQSTRSILKSFKSTTETKTN